MKTLSTGITVKTGFVVAVLFGAAFANADTITFSSGNPSFALNGATLEVTPGTVGIGEVASYVSGGTNLTGIATCWPSGNACDPGGTAVSPSSAASNIDHYWLQGDPAIIFSFSTPTSNVVAVAGIDHGPLPGEALEFIVWATDAYGSMLEEGAIKAVYEDGVDGSTGGPLIGGPGSGSISITAAESDDFSSVWTFSGSYSHFKVVSGDHLAGFSSPGEFEIDGLASETIPFEDCTAQAGGCPLGGDDLTVEAPDNTIIPDGTTVSTNSFVFADLESRCGNQPLVVNIPGTEMDFFLPKHICGFPEFIVRAVEPSDEIIYDGALLLEAFPEESILDDPPVCMTRIAEGVDPQTAAALAHQSTNAGDDLEGHATDKIWGCGSSRGRSRELSYICIGCRIDFGLDWENNAHAVRHAFIDLTHAKFHGLIVSIFESEQFLPHRQFKKIRNRALLAKLFFKLRLYRLASRQLSKVIRTVATADYEASAGSNPRGETEWRAYNLKFMVDHRVRGLME